VRACVCVVCVFGWEEEGRERQRQAGRGGRERGSTSACGMPALGWYPFPAQILKGQHYSLQRQVYGRSKIAGSYNRALPTIWPSFTSTQPTHGFGQVFPCNINYVGRAHAHGRCGRRGEGRDGEKSMFCSCSLFFLLATLFVFVFLFLKCIYQVLGVVGGQLV
jgi:hypothetical protein